MDDKIVSSHALWEELQKLPKEPIYKSGNEYLDELIGGFGEGDFIILGGSQKSGKTLLLQSWTRQFTKQGLGCLWFSVELPNRQFLKRFGEKLPFFALPAEMPTTTTHQWIEKKIMEAKKEFDVKIVFIDHLGIVADEEMYRTRNSVEILDQRLLRVKRFAIAEKLCIIGVLPFVLQSLRKKSTEPSTGDFRGTAMSGYTADTLMALDRLQGRNKVVTVNEGESAIDLLAENYLKVTDAHLYILDCRRTGARKLRIRMTLDENGEYIEYGSEPTTVHKFDKFNDGKKEEDLPEGMI